MGKMIVMNQNTLKQDVRQRKKRLLNYIKTYLELKKKLSIRYPLKSNYQINVPLNIFQTWHTKNLTPSMFQCAASIKRNNPKFNYYLFDDNDCREFIKNNYSSEVLEAFDTLIPGAYKADLWRYCILYIRGGIYLDIKYKTVNYFKFINLMEKEHWVLDVDRDGIYNALIVARPGNEILRRAIDQVVENVKNRFYGNSPLEPTGPKLLSRYFSYQEKHSFDMNHEFYFGDLNNRIINYHGIPVLKSYHGYLKDYNNTKKTEYYGNLWSQRRIYH
jgi:mannosyltransferase OCH1-like enzyme